MSTLSALEKYASAASRRDDELMDQLRAARSDLEVVRSMSVGMYRGAVRPG